MAKGIKYSGNILWLAALACIALLVFPYIFNEKPDMNGDNCYYYAFASSLAAGEGFSDMFGNPTSHFPPGYPLLMAPLRVITDSIVAQKILNLLFLFVGTILLFGTLVREGIRKEVAFLSCMAVLLTPHLLEFSTMMMSEASCFCCFALIFWLYGRIPNEDNKTLWHSPYMYAFIVALAYAYLIRTQAAVIFAAFFLALLVLRRRRLLLVAVVSFVVVYLLWSWRNKALGLGASRYMSQIDFSNIAETMKMLVVQAVPESIIPFVNVDYNVTPGVGLWIYSILLMAVIITGVYRMQRLFLPMILFLFGTFVSVSIINTPSQYRYIVTILPFLTAALFTGLWSIMGYCTTKLIKRNISPWLLLVLFVPLLWQGDGSYDKRTLNGLNKASKASFPPQFRNFVAIGRSLYKHDKDAIVATRKPELLYINSGVRAKRFVETDDDVKLISNLLKENIDYVIIEQLGFAATVRYLWPCVQRHPDLFANVLHIPNPDTLLFFFNRKAASEWLQKQ